MINELCRLAAELADEFSSELEKDEPDVVHYRLKIEFHRWNHDAKVVEPTTLEVTALWQGGEWKWTKRERVESWKPFIIVSMDDDQ